MRECLFGQSSDSLVTDCLPAMGSWDFHRPKRKETRQAVKNNHTVKGWKGQRAGDLCCRSQQAARDKIMARKVQSQQQWSRKYFRQQKVPHLPSPQLEFGLTKGTKADQGDSRSSSSLLPITPMFAILAWNTGRSLSCPLVLRTDCQHQIKFSPDRRAAIHWWNKEMISKKVVFAGIFFKFPWAQPIWHAMQSGQTVKEDWCRAEFAEGCRVKVLSLSLCTELERII